MSGRTSVTTDAGGRRVTAKLAANAEEALRLEREAQRLDAARHPGVVELVGVDGHGVGALLLTAHVDGPALAQVGRLPLEESAGLLAVVASTLADLHELGIVHGAVSPDHIIVGPGGRPVLCSLGYGGRDGEPVGPVPPLTGAFTDPARAGAEVLSPSADVFAIGALAAFLAPDPPAGHVLARVAHEATSDDVSVRPTARALAEALQHEVPAARLPRGLAPQPPARPVAARTADPLAALRNAGGGQPARRGIAVVVAGLAAVGAIGGAVLVAGSSRRPAPAIALPDLPPPDDEQPGPTTTRAGLVPSSTLAPSTTTTTAVVTSTTVPARHCAPSTAVLQADVDGDGCADALRYADGVLEAGTVRWALGQPGDQVATGDWGCQGSRTVALFRPSTGDVFRFDAWAGPGVDLRAAAVARVPGGQAIRAADVDHDGCHEAVIERGAGAAEVVRLPRTAP